MKILKEGTKVRVDPICEKTKNIYGVNDTMRKYFLGKTAIVSRDTTPNSLLVRLRQEDSMTSWSFDREDVRSYIVFEGEVKKPEVKEVIFNPEYL